MSLLESDLREENECKQIKIIYSFIVNVLYPAETLDYAELSSRVSKKLTSNQQKQVYNVCVIYFNI